MRPFRQQQQPRYSRPSYEAPSMHGENMRNLDGWNTHYAKRLDDATKLSASLKERARLQINGRINAVRNMIHGSQADFLREHARMRGDLDAYIAQLEQGTGVQERDGKQDEWCEQAGALTFILQKNEPMYIRYDRAGRSGSLSGWIRIDTDVVNSSMDGTYRVDSAVRHSDGKPAFALNIDSRFQGTFTIAQGQNRFQLDTRTAAEQYALRLQKTEEPVQEQQKVEEQPVREPNSPEVVPAKTAPAAESEKGQSVVSQPVESEPAAEEEGDAADEAAQNAQKAAELAQDAAREAEEREASFNSRLDTIQLIVEGLPAGELKTELSNLMRAVSDRTVSIEERMKVIDKINAAIDRFQAQFAGNGQ